MTYRSLTPPPAAPRRLIQPGETVRPTTDAIRMHYQCWATSTCTPEDYRPYVPLPPRGEVTSVRSEAPIRLLNVLWVDGETTVWDDDSLDPIAGR